MTASDLHQRMLHLLDRVKAMETDPPQAGVPMPAAAQPPAPAASPSPTVPEMQVANETQVPQAQPQQPAPQPQHPAQPAAATDIPDLTAEMQQPTQNPDDDRTDSRHRVLKRGVITYAAGNFKVDCTIRDISPTGAKLKLSGEVTVPSCFDLVILPENITQAAQVCWKDELELGIRFIKDD